jgi:hypothetical protein
MTAASHAYHSRIQRCSGNDFASPLGSAPI